MHALWPVVFGTVRFLQLLALIEKSMEMIPCLRHD